MHIECYSEINAELQISREYLEHVHLRQLVMKENITISDQAVAHVSGTAKATRTKRCFFCLFLQQNQCPDIFKRISIIKMCLKQPKTSRVVCVTRTINDRNTVCLHVTFPVESAVSFVTFSSQSDC